MRQAIRPRAWLSMLTSALVIAAGVPGPVAAQTPTCRGRSATIVVTPMTPQPVMGTDGDDVIVGGAADDVILALAGDDVVCGGPGDDTLDGGDGRDIVYGQAGDDTVSGGAGRDRVVGNAGRDRLDYPPSTAMGRSGRSTPSPPIWPLATSMPALTCSSTTSAHEQ